MQTVMVVEDDRSIALLLKTYLEHAGFQTQVAISGEEALSMFPEINPALVLLDLMLPGKDGWTVLDEIRQLSSCPIIMVTARGAVEDRLHGFNQGADDYILKPFDPDEVVARVKAVLRRPVHLVEPELVQFGTLVINFTSREVTVKGKTISLAPRHWELLTFLVRHPNQVFTRDQLLDHVWGMDYDGGDRAVDVSIKRIRQSLQEWPADEGEIATIRGKGYLLRVK